VVHALVIELSYAAQNTGTRVAGLAD
jgi:hypothetical protein